MGKLGTNGEDYQYCTYPRRIARPEILRLREGIVKLATHALFVNIKVVGLCVLEKNPNEEVRNFTRWKTGCGAGNHNRVG